MSQNFSGFKNILLFLFAAIILVVFIHTSLQTEKKQKDAIRIGIFEWPGHEFLFVSQHKGFFKDIGLNIELVELSSLTEIRRAFEKGKIDGMATSLMQVIKAHKYSKRTAKIVLVTDYSNGAHKIVTLPEIKSMQDLKGKKIGFKSQCVCEYLVKRALEINNIKPEDVELVPLKQHLLPNALTSRKLDAISTLPPASITLNKLMNVNEVFNSAKIPNEIINVLAIDKEILAKHPKIQNKLYKVWKRTLDFVNNNNDAYNILTDRLMISIEDFKQSLKSIKIVNNESSL